MKRMKMLGIVALAAMVVFGMTACGEDLCVDGHTWDAWDIVDGKIVRTCSVCAELEEFTKDNLIGDYTGTTRTLKLSDDKFELDLNIGTANAQKYVFTITSWGPAVKNARPSGTPTAAEYPIGLAINGTTTSNTTQNVPEGPQTATSSSTIIHIYFGKANELNITYWLNGGVSGSQAAYTGQVLTKKL